MRTRKKIKKKRSTNLKAKIAIDKNGRINKNSDRLTIKNKKSMKYRNKNKDTNKRNEKDKNNTDKKIEIKMIEIDKDKNKNIVIEKEKDQEIDKRKEIDLEVRKKIIDRAQVQESIFICIFRQKNNRYKGNNDGNRDKVR